MPLPAASDTNPWSRRAYHRGWLLAQANGLFDFFQQEGDVTATVNTFDRLTDLVAEDTETEIIPDTEAGLTDFRISGRYSQLQMSCSDAGNYMRLGKPVAFIRPTAKRR